MGQRFLVGGNSAVLRAVIEIAQDDPSIALISATGPPTRPSRLVVQMTPEQAAEIKIAFGPQLIVEPDAEVQPQLRTGTHASDGRRGD